jgi:hypothetical protein
LQKKLITSVDFYRQKKAKKSNHYFGRKNMSFGRKNMSLAEKSRVLAENA